MFLWLQTLHNALYAGFLVRVSGKKHSNLECILHARVGFFSYCRMTDGIEQRDRKPLTLDKAADFLSVRIPGLLLKYGRVVVVRVEVINVNSGRFVTARLSS